MESVLIAAFLAAVSPSAPVDDANALDRRCFGLMARLAEDEDPRVRSLGRVAAQYFLGRIDAATPGFDAASVEIPASHDQALLRRCGDAMQAGGRDFRAIGAELAAPSRRPVA